MAEKHDTDEGPRVLDRPNVSPVLAVAGIEIQLAGVHYQAGPIPVQLPDGNAVGRYTPTVHPPEGLSGILTLPRFYMRRVENGIDNLFPVFLVEKETIGPGGVREIRQMRLLAVTLAANPEPAVPK